jgi:putative adenylate-forming enzyme
VLEYAKQHSPYYHSIMSGQYEYDLPSIPKMNKTIMMEHFDEINTAGLRKDDLVEFQIRREKEGRLDLYQGKFSVGLSSGTSGNKVLTVLSKYEREMYACLLLARNGIPKTVKGRRILFALRTNNPAFMQMGTMGFKLIYVDYTHPPDELIRIINLNKLNIILGPPSLLSILAEYRSSISHKVDTIVSYAEVLDDDTKAYLEDAFGAPVIQLYQGAEGFIGSTCNRGSLHLNEDTIFIESEDIGDTIGKAKNIVVTDLYRMTQPIIRYSLNDVLEISSRPCECGSCFRVIERIHGRADDIFQLKGPNGQIRYLFPDYVRRSINQASNDILEFQAIQHSIDSIEIRLLLKEHADRIAIERTIENNLQWWAQKAGGILGKIIFSAALPERNPRSNKLIRVTRMF